MAQRLRYQESRIDCPCIEMSVGQNFSVTLRSVTKCPVTKYFVTKCLCDEKTVTKCPVTKGPVTKGIVTKCPSSPSSSSFFPILVECFVESYKINANLSKKYFWTSTSDLRNDVKVWLKKADSFSYRFCVYSEIS